MKITPKKFVDCCKNKDFLIKKSNDSKILLSNYWMYEPNKRNIFAMFFDFFYKDKKEYVKIYLDNRLRHYPNLIIEVYLLGHGKVMGIKGERRDFSVRTFSNFLEFKNFFENIQKEIKKVLDNLDRGSK